MSTLDAKSLGGVPKLKGTENYDVWAMKAAQLLIREDFYDAIEPTDEDKADKSFSKKNRQARATIILTLDDAILEHAKRATTAKELWEPLKELFSLAGFSAHHLLLQGLVKTSLESHGSVTEFVEAVKRQGCQLKELDLTVPDWIFVSVLLHGLGDTYEVFVSSTIQSMRQKQPPAPNEVISQLLDEERRRTGTETGTALLAKKRDKTVQCSYCKGGGHTQNTCWRLHPDLRPKKGQKIGKGKDDSKKKDEGKTKRVLVAHGKQDALPTTWYLDLGASEHVTSLEAMFSQLSRAKSSIHLGDDSVKEIVGTGQVDFTFLLPNSQTQSVTFTGVKYVPTMRYNLLSVSRLLNESCRVIFKDNGCKVFHEDILLAIGQQEGNLFRLAIKQNHALVVQRPVKPLSITLWHQQLGHLGLDLVKKTAEQVTRMKLDEATESQLCIACVEGKQHREPSQRLMERATAKLELIHTDIGSPITPTSAEGAR